MACSSNLYPRIAGRVGQPTGLDVTFFHNGVPRDPYALRRIDIYYQEVKAENLKAQIIFGEPDQSGYPAPAITDPTRPGYYMVEFQVPETFGEGIYFDVWRFIGSAPVVGDGTGSGATWPNLDDETTWVSQCNKFWVFCDGWFLDDGLITARFGFEPLDRTFRKGELRNLEVSIMPLPLYDYNASRINPMIPQVCPFIRVETEHGEVLAGLEKAPCKIGLRQGSYRTNPYVIQCPLDTSAFLKGSYVYRIILELPNGDVRISDPFRFEII
jgi:hypothetical protein